MKKFEQIKLTITNHNIDILCITESLLDDTISNNELAINDFQIIRNDRNRHGGGCAMYIRNSVTFSHELSLQDQQIEALWCQIRPSKGDPFLVGCIYRHPNSLMAYFDRLINNIEKASNFNYNMVLLGDFKVDVSHCTHQYYNKISSMCDLFNFTQLITEPTRVTPHTSSIIDLIFTTILDEHSDSGITKITLSDHYMISTIGHAPIVEKHKILNCRSYLKFDVNNFLLDLQLAFQCFPLDNFIPISVLWDKFKDLFISVCDKHAPMKQFRAKTNSNPWVDSEVTKLIKKRDNIHDLAIKHSDERLFNQYRTLRNSVTSMIRSNKINYISDILSKKQGPRGLWNAVSHLTGKNNYDKDNIPNDLSSESMNHFFANVLNKLVAEHAQISPLWKGNSSLYEFHFQIIHDLNVFNHLLKLPTHSNIDILNFDSKLLIISAPVIYTILTCLFNASIVQSCVPCDWKCARVTPVYKGKGSRSDPSNYRPISVICHIAKIFEKCIQVQLLSFLEQHHFISPDQSAFLKFNSTVSSIHKVVDNWLNNIEEGLITCVCLFDITKCFDSISHSVLLFKLEKYGIQQSELKWFASYLEDRSQATICHGSLSSFLSVKTGVPQGSILGPILFLLFINDLPNFVKSANLYADDTLIDRWGKNLSDIIPFMQQDINSLCRWFESNKLSISKTKSCCMLIGSQQKIANFENLDSLGLFIGDTPLVFKHSYMYLGLEIDSKLSWSDSINSITKKLRSQLAALQRICSLIPLSNPNSLYYSFIQSHIDYCITVWGHTSIENIN